ncbi:MAG TPA: nucleotidyltransferase family protein [Rectinemataceae bacterium]|nr:nucleotidyltransferase family protein [Rectinemataceae bacterium]
MKPAEAAAPDEPNTLFGSVAPAALAGTAALVAPAGTAASAAPATSVAPSAPPCILLAAGASSRMGRPKLLLPLDGELVVRRTARIALAHCRPLIVVTGFGRENIEAALSCLDDIIFVFNPDWRAGMVTSVLAGIEALPADCPGFFLHHADMPFVDVEVFAVLSRAASRQIAAAGYTGTPSERPATSLEHSSTTLGRPEAPSEYPTADAGHPGTPIALVAGRNGKAGHPVYFPASYIPAIQAQRTGERLKDVLAALGSLIVETGCDGVLEDMDSPEEYAALAAKYGLSPEADAIPAANANPEPLSGPGDVAMAKT